MDSRKEFFTRLIFSLAGFIVCWLSGGIFGLIMAILGILMWVY